MRLARHPPIEAVRSGAELEGRQSSLFGVQLSLPPSPELPLTAAASLTFDQLQKLFGPGKNISNVPASGPAPVLLRLDDWFVLVPEYEELSARMEADTVMTNKLGACGGAAD